MLFPGGIRASVCVLGQGEIGQFERFQAAEDEQKVADILPIKMHCLLIPACLS